MVKTRLDLQEERAIVDDVIQNAQESIYCKVSLKFDERILNSTENLSVESFWL